MSDERVVLFRRTAPARLDAIAGLCREAKGALGGLMLSAEAAYGIDLVLEEILTNVAKYAYAPGAPGNVDLGLEFGGGAVILRFRDEGRPFDPLSVPPPPPALSRERPGGLGISLVRSVARDVLYRREGGTNVLDVLVPAP